MNYFVDAMLSLQWFFLLYFVAVNSVYLMLNVLAYATLRRHLDAQILGELPQAYANFKPPISVLVPAYNEASTIAASVRSLMQLTYHEFEVIVINDGSKDGTLAELQREFDLIPFAEAYWNRLPTQQVRGIWRSMRHPNLRVIDKENGGKADALNAGINASRYPLFCAVDADSILQRNSLQLIVQPFIEDARTIAAGGSVRVVNGCEASGGFLTSIGLPRKLLPLLQIVEYLRAFMFGRLGWSPINAMLVISGAFGLFRKSSVIEVGGYRTDTVGEDMELVVRLHRLHRKRRIPYRIVFVPNPVCWTEVPETLRILKNQRVRWQRGLSESLMMNMGLLFSPRGGWVGWVAFPFTLIFEWVGPVIEVAGYVFVIAGYWMGVVSLPTVFAFTMVAIMLGVLLSISVMLIEEMSFHLYPRPRQLAVLLLMSVLENFGYRQITLLWRLNGLLHWLFGSKAKWGTMTRSASWHQPKR
jgi:cellulose synthase/poly-beta-1,6-N-acetylglucosamine synthase-like glycosyltransferase